MPQIDTSLINYSEIALRSVMGQLAHATTPSADAIQSHLETTIRELTGKHAASDGALSLEKNAIGLAVKGVLACYDALKDQSRLARRQQDRFDEETRNQIALFSVPINRRPSQLPFEQRFMSRIFRLLDEYPSIKPFMGIRTAVDADKNIRTDVTWPFYIASYALPQPLASIRALDKERIAIFTFYTSVVPEIINRIEASTDYSWTWTVILSLVKGDYLDNQRLSRFFVMAFTNLLWSLQHPVNTETGFPRPVDTCIELCTMALKLINQILDTSHQDHIGLVNNNTNHLTSFMNQIEIHIKSLRLAYIEKKSRDINVIDLVNQAHETLRIIDHNVLKLIYAKKDSASMIQSWWTGPKGIEIPYDYAARHMAHNIYFMNTSLNINGNYPVIIQIIDTFSHDLGLGSENKYMNTPPRTLIDILIVFCHLSCNKRQALVETIKEKNLPSASAFADSLAEFNKRFIQPIRDIFIPDSYYYHFLRRFQLAKDIYRNVALMTARHLVPLITLLAEDYRLDLDLKIDMPDDPRSALTSPGADLLASTPVVEPNSNLSRPLSGNEQVRLINHHACSFRYQQDDSQYYTHNLALFIGVSYPYDHIINQLSSYQYLLTKTSRLLDKIGEILEHHRDWLQQDDFREQLLESLKKVQSRYNDFKHYVDSSREMLNRGEHIRRNLISVLTDMADELQKNVHSINTLMDDLNRNVSSTHFTTTQKELIVNVMSAINADYADVLEDQEKPEKSEKPTRVPSSSTKQPIWSQQNSHTFYSQNSVDDDDKQSVRSDRTVSSISMESIQAPPLTTMETLSAWLAG